MAVSFLFKRSSTVNAQPTVGNLPEGELNLNNNVASAGLFFKDSSNALVKVGPAVVSVTAPTNPPVGTTWMDSSGPWLNVRDSTSWYRSAQPGTSSRILGALSGVQTPLHIWSFRQWVATSGTTQQGTIFSCRMTTANSDGQDWPIPLSTNVNLQNSWLSSVTNGEDYSECKNLFDQIGNRTLFSYSLFKWLGAGYTTDPLVGSLWGFVPTTDGVGQRYMADTPNITQVTEQGPAMWVILQFNMWRANNNTGQILFEPWSSNSTYGNGSMTIQRGTGSNLLIARRVDGTDPYMFNNNIPCDVTQTGKNTLLYYDNGTGNVQMSINGGALVAGNTSRNQDYVIGNGGVNIGGADNQPTNRNWNNPICTCAYWVGTTANCPSAATMQNYAAQMHALI